MENRVMDESLCVCLFVCLSDHSNPLGQKMRVAGSSEKLKPDPQRESHEQVWWHAAIIDLCENAKNTNR